MSESLSVGGWRVRDAAAELAVQIGLEQSRHADDLPRRRYRRGALVRRSCSSPTCWASTSPSSLRTRLLPSLADSVDEVSPGYEYVAFLLAIPVWILLLRLEGLYDRDEERTDHSTVDDIVGVFRSVTIGVWIFALFGVATGTVQPMLARLGVFWLIAVVLIPTCAQARGRCAGTCPATRRTPSSSAPDGRPAARAEADEPSRVRHQPRRIRRRSSHRARRRAGARGSRCCSAARTDCASSSRSTSVERVIIAFSNDSHESVLANIRAIRDLDVQIDIVPRYFELFGAGAERAHARRHSARRAPAAAAVAVVPCAEAGVRPRRQRRSVCSSSRRSSPSSRSASGSSRAGRSSSARSAAARTGRRSGSTSSGRWSPMRRSGRPRSRT